MQREMTERAKELATLRTEGAAAQKALEIARTALAVAKANAATSTTTPVTTNATVASTTSAGASTSRNDASTAVVRGGVAQQTLLCEAVTVEASALAIAVYSTHH
jgi:hypothetical protein